jgi:hypothetical protein
MSQTMSHEQDFEKFKLGRAMPAEFSAFAEFSAAGEALRRRRRFWFKPPDTLIASPVIHAERCDARNTTAEFRSLRMR